MDVEREITAANRRLDTQAQQLARAAEQRLQREYPIAGDIIIEQPANPAEAYGQFLRAFHDAFKALADGVARGWSAVDRAQAPIHEFGSTT